MEWVCGLCTRAFCLCKANVQSCWAGGKWLRGSVDVGNSYNCSAPWSCLRGNQGSSTGGESLPRGMRGAPVTCALFPLFIERWTPRDPALDAKMCNSVDLAVWKRQRLFAGPGLDCQPRNCQMKRPCLQAELVGTLG